MVGTKKTHHVVGGSLLWVLFWLNTGSNPQTLTQTCTNFTKRNSIKHFITSNNFQKLTEWINGYRSWVVSRYNSRPRRPSVRQCCLRPGDQKSMENQKISKKKNVTGNPPSAEFTSKIFKKKLKFTIFIHFKKERAKNCWPQLTTVDWASLPARGAHPRVASWMLSPTELRLLGWDTSSNPNLCFFVGMMLENNKGTKGIKGFWVFGNVWCICSLMEPLVTSDLIHQPEPQWCDHYTGLYKSPAVRPHRQERWSFMIVRWWKSCHEDEQHFTSKWLLAQNVPYARLWRSMLMTSHQWYPLTPSTTAAHQTKLFNIWHQHSFLEQHRGMKPLAPMIHCTPTLGCWASWITRMATLRLADWLEVVEGLSHYDFARDRVQATVWNNFNLQIFTKLYKAKKSWAITPSDHPAKVPANGRKGPLPVERNEGYLHNSRRFKQLGVRARAGTCQHSRVTKDSFLNCIHQGPSGQKLKKKNKGNGSKISKIKMHMFLPNNHLSYDSIFSFEIYWNIIKWINYGNVVVVYPWPATLDIPTPPIPPLVSGKLHRVVEGQSWA